MCSHGAHRQPLAGLRILDCTAALPGPYATQLLADLGACVLKIERPPAGDTTREDMPALFEAFNRGKHSVIVDLKSDEGVRDYERLVKHADVIVEGFRPGVMNRLGVGEVRTRDLNPRIIYISISGWGQTGELAHKPGHDLNYLGLAGALRGTDSSPTPPGVLMADLSSGSTAAVAILAAVIERDRTGEGVSIDLGMADVALLWAVSANAESLNPSSDSDVMTHEDTVPGHGVYATSDGQWVTLGLIEDKFFRVFQEFVEDSRLELPRFQSFAGRRTHFAELRKIIAEIVASKPVSYWLEGSEALDLPLFPVLGFSEALNHDQFVQRGVVKMGQEGPELAFPALWDEELLSAGGDVPKVGDVDVDDIVSLWS